MGGCEEMGVPWEKVLAARWEALQGAGCPPSWLPPAQGVYKYALGKRGFALVGGSPGERAGKKNPTLSPR